jgi:hypothetical protein
MILVPTLVLPAAESTTGVDSEIVTQDREDLVQSRISAQRWCWARHQLPFSKSLLVGDSLSVIESPLVCRDDLVLWP